MSGIPKDIKEKLSKIIEPETGKSILDSGMVKKVKVDGKKVKIELVPISAGCAFCIVMNQLIGEIKDALSEIGYEAYVEIEF
jgi:ATP-binding protein involved in chromosome partitioning